jgi:methylated-DNA-[protein]-cysteine S-methyltransferase
MTTTVPPTLLTAVRHETPVGTLTVVASDRGVRAVLWPDDRPGRVPLVDVVELDGGHPVLDRARTELDEYFAGRRRGFDVPLDLQGTPFQVQVWHALAHIPFGTTSTYLEQARRLGRPTGARAVGAAIGRNPVSVVLPCHRVVGTGGALTGFAGGLDAKRWLLAHERDASGSED